MVLITLYWIAYLPLYRHCCYLTIPHCISFPGFCVALLCHCLTSAAVFYSTASSLHSSPRTTFLHRFSLHTPANSWYLVCLFTVPGYILLHRYADCAVTHCMVPFDARTRVLRFPAARSGTTALRLPACLHIRYLRNTAALRTSCAGLPPPPEHWVFYPATRLSPLSLLSIHV